MPRMSHHGLCLHLPSSWLLHCWWAGGQGISLAWVQTPSSPHTFLPVQESTLSDDSTPPSSSPKIPSGPRQEAKCSYPYHTLSQSSDEVSKAGRGAAGAFWLCQPQAKPLTLLDLCPSSWMSPSPPSSTGPASKWASGYTASIWTSTLPSLLPDRWMGHSCCSWMEAN
jgi:hypothetical protein